MKSKTVARWSLLLVVAGLLVMIAPAAFAEGGSLDAKAAGKLGGAIHCGCSGVHGLDVGGGTILNGLDGGANFLGGVHGLFGQLADFVGNDRETTPSLACSSGLNGRVERTPVGLFGPGLNDVQHLLDVVGLLRQSVNIGGCSQFKHEL